MRNSDGRRPIDRLRDGAGQLTVGTEADGFITGFVALADVAYTVKEGAVYIVQMADDIDPDRLNIEIPNTVQLVLSAGSESDLVARTFLTADELFKKNLFPEATRDRVLLIALEIARHLLSAEEIKDRLKASTDLEAQSITSVNRSANLPSTPSLRGGVDAFVQAIHSGVQHLYDLPREFVKLPPRGWPDNFSEALKEKFEESHPAVRFAETITPFVKFVRNARHCIEHRRGDRRIEVRDFHLSAEGIIHRPSLRIVHEHTPLDHTDVVHFMTSVIEELLAAAENMLGQVAQIGGPADFAGFPIAVALIPEDQRRSGSRIRLGYCAQMEGQWVRFA